MKFLQSLLDALLLGVHQLSVIDAGLWGRKSDNSTVIKTIALATLILNCLFTSIVAIFFLYNHTFGYYSTDTYLMDSLYIAEPVVIFALLYYYVYRYRGVGILKEHIATKDTVKCVVVVIICVAAFCTSAHFTRSQNIGYRVRTGWYERNPSKYAKMAKEIEDWKKEHPESW